MAKEKDTQQKVELTEEQLRFQNVIRKLSKVGKDEDPPIGLLTDMNADVERFSSGSLILDTVIGGGFPVGRIIEIYGAEASGKTSLALTTIAGLQAQGKNCVFIDAESALDTKYAQKLGVDLDLLGYSQESVAETVFDLMIALVDSGTVDLIVLDSVAALSTNAEFDEDMDKQTMAVLARAMGKGLRKLTPRCSKNNCSVIFLNQTRDNVGVLYGAKTTTPGGKALRFSASQRIQVSLTGIETDSNTKEVIGRKIKVKCIKNKVSAPFGEGEITLTFANGISKEGEILFVGKELGVITQKGYTYYYMPKEGEEVPEGLDFDKELGIKIGVYEMGALEGLRSDGPLYPMVSKAVTKELARKNEVGDITAESLENTLQEI